MELTITSISETKVLRHAIKLARLDGKKEPTKLSGKAIQAACLQDPGNIYFLNRSFFPIHIGGGGDMIPAGDEVSFKQLEQLGVREFVCRFNHDRSICTIKVK